MDPGKQHQTGRGVAQVVNTNVRQTGILEGAVQDLSRCGRLQGAATAIREDQIAAVATHLCPMIPPQPMPTKSFDRQLA